MDGEDEEVAHGVNRTIVASSCKTAPQWRIRSYYDFATHTILACDFFVAVTAMFRVLYVFVSIEHGRRHLAHVNITEHPIADWTLQQAAL